MITVRFFGMLRLNSGMKELNVEAADVKTLLRQIEILSSGTVKAVDLQNCILMINGKQAKRSSRLTDGDQVMILSPAAGG